MKLNETLWVLSALTLHLMRKKWFLEILIWNLWASIYPFLLFCYPFPFFSPSPSLHQLDIVPNTILLCATLYTPVFWSSKRPGLQTLNFNFHTFPFIFKNSLTSERMDIHTILYSSFISQTFISKISLSTYTFSFLKMKVCEMNEKYNNLWMSIRSLVNAFLKLNENVWQWKFRVWSPGAALAA